MPPDTSWWVAPTLYVRVQMKELETSPHDSNPQVFAAEQGAAEVRERIQVEALLEQLQDTTIDDPPLCSTSTDGGFTSTRNNSGIVAFARLS